MASFVDKARITVKAGTAAEETARGRAAGSGLHSRTNSENDSSKIPSF